MYLLGLLALYSNLLEQFLLITIIFRFYNLLYTYQNCMKEV